MMRAMDEPRSRLRDRRPARRPSIARRAARRGLGPVGLDQLKVLHIAAGNHVRFTFFCRAALEVIPQLASGARMVHAHDRHALLALLYVRTELATEPCYRSGRAMEAFVDHEVWRAHLRAAMAGRNRWTRSVGAHSDVDAQAVERSQLRP